MTTEFYKNIERQLPDLCTAHDLVNVGIYKSMQAAYYARRMQDCPAFFKLTGRGIVYPKESVLEFLNRKITEAQGNESFSNQNS